MHREQDAVRGPGILPGRVRAERHPGIDAHRLLLRHAQRAKIWRTFLQFYFFWGDLAEAQFQNPPHVEFVILSSYIWGEAIIPRLTRKKHCEIKKIDCQKTAMK